MDLPPLCECTECEGFAVFTMAWPGKPPLRVCLVDGARAAGVAEAMGFKLDLRLIPGASCGVPAHGRPTLRQLLEIE